MASPKTYSEVVCLVKNEVESIRKRDGVLPPTAYVVAEVANRMKTMQPWQGYDAHAPLAYNLRCVIEELTKGKVNANRPKKEDPDDEVIWISPNPYDALEESLGGSKGQVSRSVDRAPVAAKKAKLKKKMKQVS